MKKILLICLLLSSVTSFFAQNNQNFELKLKSGHFVPDEIANLDNALKYVSNESNQSFIYRIVQFNQIPTNEEKVIFKSAGIELLDYIPNNAFVCRLKKDIKAFPSKGMNIRSILAIKEEYKLSAELTKKELPDWALIEKDIRLVIKYFTSDDKEELLHFINNNQGKVLSEMDKVNALSLQISVDKISNLVQNPMVQWIEAIPPPATKDDILGTNSTRSNTLNSAYNAGRKYDGSGITVALGDDGIPGPHIDFTGRLTLQTDKDDGNHGDMTSGVFVGAGNLDPKVVGTAPGADLNVYRVPSSIFTNYPYIQNGVTNMMNLGTVISSTSYSQGTGGTYTVLSEFADQQINQYPNIIHCFSAGNSGTRDHDYGAGAGWGNIGGSIKAGKNVIAVGQVDQFDQLHITSSRGPAKDGRIKPDLLAMGNGQISTNSGNTFQSAAGTSAATPLLAGVVTQLYQAYKENNGGNEPETGLLKAALMNTAEDLGNPGPDFKHGWGRINALKAVRTLEENRYIRDNISQGMNKSHVISVPNNVSKVRIMTYWIDAAGSPSASVALVNDINMQVTDPVNAVYDPWVLDPTPIAANLNAPAVRGIDNLNNVEQVTIDNPTAGDYMVNLSGFAIPQGPQTYYVIYDFIYNEIELTYPLGGEGFVPGEKELITWDASIGTDIITLEYSTDGGSTFNLISNSIPANTKTYDWTAPNLVSNNVKVRVSRGSSSSESVESFTIIDTPNNFTIDQVCPDSISLSWDIVNGASAYEISMLGEKYMDSIGVSTTNSFKIYGLIPTDVHWFSVRSIVDGKKGRRAIAIEKVPGTVNCILNNDIELAALLSPIDGISKACTDLSKNQVVIKIQNLGLLTASNFDLTYQLNDNPIVSEVFSNTLMPGEEFIYTFSTPIDVSNPDVYFLKANVSFGPDQNEYNDDINTSFEILPSDLKSTPYSENLQSFSSCATSTNCGQTTCLLSNGLSNLENGVWDDIDWRVNSGATNSSDTGPTTDYDLGTDDGQYLYLESSTCYDKTASMLTPCIDLSNTTCPKLEFAYHMSGEDMGELHVDLITKDGLFEDVMTPISGNQGLDWKVASIDLRPYIGDTINIKFRGITGPAYTSDMAIDAISVIEATPIADFIYSVSNFTVSFADISAGNIDTYFWDFGDGNTSTDDKPTNVYGTGGTYDVTLIVEGECGRDTLVQSIDVSPSSTTNTFDSAVKIYPNPTTGNFVIFMPKQLLAQDISIKMIDMVGKSTTIFTNDDKKEKLSIDASNFSDGIYILEILGKQFSVKRKIIIN